MNSEVVLDQKSEKRKRKVYGVSSSLLRSEPAFKSATCVYEPKKKRGRFTSFLLRDVTSYFS